MGKGELDPAIIKKAKEEGIFDPETVDDVVVLCDEYLANIIQTRSLHPDQKIILNNNRCELHVKKMSKYKIITWVMHQCGRAEIYSPAKMRSEISGFAQKIPSIHQVVKK